MALLHLCCIFILNSDFFYNFWRKFRFFKITNKQYIINAYEVGLSRKALKANLKLDAFCTYHDVVQHTLNTYYNYPYRRLIKCCPVNPSHFLWKVLIHDFNYPFIKIELLRDNPAEVVDSYSWERSINMEFYDSQLIRNHLKRLRSSGNEQR